MPGDPVSTEETSYVNPGGGWDATIVNELIAQLTSIREELLRLERDLRPRLASVAAENGLGAINMVHYVGLRRRDLREIQDRLAWMGLSSLGRSESHVLANLDKVLGLLHALAAKPWSPRSMEEPAGYRSSARRLEAHTASLFGAVPSSQHGTRIMVTLGSEAGADFGFVRELIASGMNCARINCAHDDPRIWAAMIANLRRAARESGQPCPVLMDLGGPKLRTGDVEPGPAVVKWRPRRNVLGHVIAPARIFLAPRDGSSSGNGVDACVQVDGPWLAGLRQGARLEFVDARSARRFLTVSEPAGAGWIADAHQTAYVTSDTVIYDENDNGVTVGAIPQTAQMLLLRTGDILMLTHEDVLGRPAELNVNGKVVRSASIPCTLPQVFPQLRAGERVWFDDGRFGGVVRQVSHGEVHVEITVAREDGERLGADKGINFPDSKLDLPALTPKDLQDLKFVAAHADLVGLSFVQRPADIEQLQSELARLNRKELGIILKIETRRAFENLPDLLLTAMRSARTGVMIARGDLAVELGYERLAEVQEEILWITEAAHLPVIWATQVLENLAKHGQPSRAEITDAAMSERAECVMLNKGPYVIEAVRALNEILTRMQAHQQKKRAMMRPLHWWTAREEGATL